MGEIEDRETKLLPLSMRKDNELVIMRNDTRQRNLWVEAKIIS